MKELLSRRLLAASLALAAFLLAGCGRSGPPYSPQEVLETFQIEDGFRIELFAAEPDVIDPVAMEFDEFGRIYVVENSGYPLDTEGGVGKVKLLEDTNGDGRPDRTTVFADRLTMPTGVMAWKKGILVTDAPHVLYLEDSNRDGRADVRRVVLTGFAFTNPQHTVSSPAYGLDNWIYLSHEGYTRAVVFSKEFGDTGDVIHYPDRPGGPLLEMARRSVRFRPDRFGLEYLAGLSQFGQTFDRWGRLFTHNNSNHIRHEVLASRYLERNPHLRLPSPWHDMSDHGNAAEVFPITIRPRFEILSGAGQITSACGLTLYLGGRFPPEFENVSFVAEPVHNLVHRDVWRPDGATFVAKRARENAEFLASTDSWFRPVNLYVGPDGALYLLDYYREVIEHPEWTSAQTYESGEIYRGNDRGRIYRIVPEQGLPLAANVHLGEATDAELIRQLENPNVWWRRTAQRLLVDRQSAAAPALEEIVKSSSSAVARVHALWTLEGLGKLAPDLLLTALGDAEPGVRENALILAEAFLGASPELRQRLLKMADDPDPRVRFQLLATLGYVNSQEARALRDKLLFENIEDSWTQVAALSWPSETASALFAKAVARGGGLTREETKGRAFFFERLAVMIGSGRKSGEIRALLQAVSRDSGSSNDWWPVASLRGLAAALAGSEPGVTLELPQQKTLLNLAESPSQPVRRAALQVLEAVQLRKDASLQAALERAARTAANSEAGPEQRGDAIRLLALANPAPHEELLKGLIGAKTPEPLQVAAVRAFGKIEGKEIAAFLLENWRSMTGPVRAEAGDAMFHNEDRVRMLVKKIEQGEIQSWMLTSRQRHRLIMHPDPAFREHARQLITQPEGEREKVLKRYEAALAMEGDAARGREVFERACSKCHPMNGAGKEVGPDLATVRSRPAQLILSDILMPNQSIAQTYEAYVVETVDGRTLDGVIGPQGPTFVTLRRENGEEDVIQRKDIKNMYATNLSAMPADLEQQVSIEQMADLIRYIKSAR